MVVSSRRAGCGGRRFWPDDSDRRYELAVDQVIDEGRDLVEVADERCVDVRLLEIWVSNTRQNDIWLAEIEAEEAASAGGPDALA